MKTVGIIGTGNMGMGLAKQFAKLGYDVMLGSRNPEKAKEKADSIEGKVKSGTIQEAADFGDIVVPAVKFPLVLDVLKQLGSLEGKIVLDISNPVGVELESTTSAAEEIAKVIPRTKIIKAFNTIFSSIIHTNPKYGDQKATLLICGDDKESKKTVAVLAEEMGYEPIDVGPLKNARYTEAMTLLLIQVGTSMEKWDIAWKLLQR